MGTRKSFSGSAVPTTITSELAASTLSFATAEATGYPDGSSGPFVVTLDLGLPTQETILVTSRTGVLFTVDASGRGYDGTTDQLHANGASVHHTVDSRTVDEANLVASVQTTKGDLVGRTTAGIVRVAVGFHGAVLMADEDAATGLAWVLPQPILCPTWYLGGDTAPVGWLSLDGGLFVDEDCPLLAAAIAAIDKPWNIGNENDGFTRLPSMNGKVPLGIDAEDLAGEGTHVFGATVGAHERSILPDNLPPHAHTQQGTLGTIPGGGIWPLGSVNHNADTILGVTQESSSFELPLPTLPLGVVGLWIVRAL